MAYVEWLSQQIAPRIRSGEIGQPVFIRANLEIAADHGLLLPVAAQTLEAAVELLGGSVHSVYAQGGVRDGYISLLVEFSGGETALLGAEINGDSEPSARIHISGRNGTLRVDDFPEPAQLARPEMGAAARWLSMIERALATGRPALAAER